MNISFLLLASISRRSSCIIFIMYVLNTYIMKQGSCATLKLDQYVSDLQPLSKVSIINHRSVLFVLVATS